MDKLSKEIKEEFLLNKEHYGKIPVSEEEEKYIKSLNKEDREKYIKDNDIKKNQYPNEHEYYRAKYEELSDKDLFFILQCDIASYLRTIKNIMIFFFILTLISILIAFLSASL